MAVFLGDFAFFTRGRTLFSLEVQRNTVKKYTKHRDYITCLRAAGDKLYTAGADSRVIIWTFPEFIELELSAPVGYMAVGHSFLYFTQGSPTQISKIDLKKREFSQKSLLRNQVSDVVALEISGDFLSLVVMTKNSLKIVDLNTEIVREHSHPVTLTSLAVHPTMKFVLCGDAAGQITRFYPEVKSKVHWHSHAVSSLQFTSDGSYFFSGGEEGVVVLWHESSQVPSFLPRLGSGITDIAVNSNSDLYLVKLRDSSIVVLASDNYETVAKHEGLTNPEEIIPDSKVFCFIMEHNQLVLNASPGYLQFYNVFTGSVRKLDCVVRNPVSRSHADYPTPLQVVQVAFSGKFMVTLEEAVNAMIPLSYLKFWKNEEINTLIMHPHSDSAYRVVAARWGTQFISLGKTDVCVWEWDGEIFKHANFMENNGLSTRDLCVSEGLFVAYENVIREYSRGYEKVGDVFEPFNEEYIEIKASAGCLIARTNGNLYVLKGTDLVWSLALSFIHGIYAENGLFLVGLNASKYTPLEERLQKVNVLLKFSVESHVPLKIYKVSKPRIWCLVNDEAAVIDEFFEFRYLEGEIERGDELVDIEIKKSDDVKQKLGVEVKESYVRYVSNRPLYSLEGLKSYELPDMAKVFEEVIVKELESIQ